MCVCLSVWVTVSVPNIIVYPSEDKLSHTGPILQYKVQRELIFKILCKLGYNDYLSIVLFPGIKF